jgi:hypothetical protein
MTPRSSSNFITHQNTDCITHTYIHTHIGPWFVHTIKSKIITPVTQYTLTFVESFIWLSETLKLKPQDCLLNLRLESPISSSTYE